MGATKPPQRPHHWMNADGTCHAGDLFEAGTPSMPLYTFEQMEAWVTAEAAKVREDIAAALEAARDDYCDGCDSCDGNTRHGLNIAARIARSA